MFNEKIFIGKNASAPMDQVLYQQIKNVALIVHFEGKYLVFHWKKSGVKTLVTGDLLPLENLLDAAQRVLIEATGYCSIKVEEYVNAVSSTQYFDQRKDINREIFYFPCFIQLESLDQVPTFKKCSSYKTTWMSEEEIKGIGLLDHQLYMFESTLLS